MWLMTTHGFFSAVCAREGDGGRSRGIDLERMMVRVRDPQHLDNLIQRFPRLESCERLRTPESDYPERLFVPKAEWAEIVAALVGEQDYDNFKDAVGRARLTSASYSSALHTVWGTMRRLQTGAREQR